MTDYKKPSKKMRRIKWSIITFFLFIPALITAVYYYGFASDIYVSEAQFSVYANEDVSQLDALTSLGLAIDDGETKDILLVREYILSKEMLQHLEEDIGIQAIYQSDKADQLTRLTDAPTQKELLEYYRKMVDLDVYREASLLSLKARAFTPEDSQKIGEAIIKRSETFINDLSLRIKNDSVKQAEAILEDVEGDIVDLKERIAAFRQDNEIVDPIKEIESRYAFIGSLEALRAELIAKRSTQGATMRRNSFSMQSASKEIANISQQIKKAKADLVKESGEKSKALEGFEVLMLEDDFMRKKYELALFNLEETYRSSNKQNKYIVSVVDPILPDYAAEPNKMRSILSVLFFTFLGLSIIGLITSSIKDHMI